MARRSGGRGRKAASSTSASVSTASKAAVAQQQTVRLPRKPIRISFEVQAAPPILHEPAPQRTSDLQLWMSPSGESFIVSALESVESRGGASKVGRMLQQQWNALLGLWSIPPHNALMFPFKGFTTNGNFSRPSHVEFQTPGSCLQMHLPATRRPQPIREPLSLPQTLRVSKRLAEGFHHLAQHGYVHGSISPLCVFLYREMVGEKERLFPRITETGLNVGLPRLIFPDCPAVQIKAYQAPEILQGNPPSTQSDVYAFGMLLCQLFSSKPIFFQAKTISQLEAYVLGGGMPDPPDLREEMLVNIIKACLTPQPMQRPSFAEIDNMITSFFNYMREKQLRATAPQTPVQAAPMQPQPPTPISLVAGTVRPASSADRVHSEPISEPPTQMARTAGSIQDATPEVLRLMFEQLVAENRAMKEKIDQFDRLQARVSLLEKQCAESFQNIPIMWEKLGEHRKGWDKMVTQVQYLRHYLYQTRGAFPDKFLVSTLPYSKTEEEETFHKQQLRQQAISAIQNGNI